LLYLPITMRDDFVRSLTARYMTMAVVVMIIGSGLAIEGGGRWSMRGQQLPLFIPEPTEPNNGYDQSQSHRRLGGIE
jgi:hypothetical protein